MSLHNVSFLSLRRKTANKINICFRNSSDSQFFMKLRPLKRNKDNYSPLRTHSYRWFQKGEPPMSWCEHFTACLKTLPLVRLSHGGCTYKWTDHGLCQRTAVKWREGGEERFQRKQELVDYLCYRS